MYTRIKNQKSGIKLLTNASCVAARSRVPNSLSSAPQSSSSSSTAGDSPSSTSLSSLSSQIVPQSFMSTVVTNSSMDDSTTTVCLDLNHNQTGLIGKVDREPQLTRIPFESSNLMSTTTASNKKTTTSYRSNGNSNNRKKLNKDEENGDTNCMQYVKSTWEKYASEIGTEQGPLRHVVDANSEYPHLNGFVAFDLEHWWAERALVSIGELRPSSSSSSSSSTSSSSITSPTTLTAAAAAKNNAISASLSPLSNLKSFTIGFS